MLDKTFDCFHKNKNRIHGLHEYCKECRKTENKASAIRSKNNYHNNRDKCLKKMAEFYQANKIQKQEYGRKHYLNNKVQYLVNATSRKAHVKLATPLWLSVEDKWMIKEAYTLAALRTKLTGIVWEVDHVIPLRGKKVCGLHIITNLQVIPRKENNAKRNKYEP